MLTIKKCPVSQLTDYESRRFKNNNICSACGEEIENNKYVVMIKNKCGRSIKYSFYHKHCVIEL